ncbi:MAG: acyl-CoA thioesterase [Muribaculaceae bacterium]
MKKLTVSKEFEIRFSEVDSMKVVWHGSYPLYFEDAREYFGHKTGLGYSEFIANGVYAPIVELNIKYHRPLIYGMKPRIDITYIPTESAKIVFEYAIFDTATGELMASARSMQVFTGTDYQLLLDNPEFYRNWKQEHQVL